MARRHCALALLLAALSLTARAAPPAEAVRAAVSAEITPAIVAVRDVVAVVAPAPAARRQSYREQVATALATRLIVRWEVTSPVTYTRRYEGVIWPGGASGPTWGIGYDGGHQARVQIESDWKAHPQLRRLVATAGVTGQEARTRLAEWAGVRTPYALAEDVFASASLPQYQHAARRAIGAPWADLAPGTQAALVDLGYNRGWSTTGRRRAHVHAIVHACAPVRDEACIARQLRDMCALWAGTPNGPGLCARREDEARYAEGRHG